MTNAEARFNIALRPRKPEGSLGRPAQDGHLDSHTAPELWMWTVRSFSLSLVSALHSNHMLHRHSPDENARTVILMDAVCRFSFSVSLASALHSNHMLHRHSPDENARTVILMDAVCRFSFSLSLASALHSNHLLHSESPDENDTKCKKNGLYYVNAMPFLIFTFTGFSVSL